MKDTLERIDPVTDEAVHEIAHGHARRRGRQERMDCLVGRLIDFLFRRPETLAKVLAFNLRRLAKRTGIGFLLATTHEDIIEDLDPDVLVCCDLDGRVSVVRGPSSVAKRPGGNGQRTMDDGRKRAVSFFAPSGSAKVPKPTGRTSLDGITAATTCA